MTLPLGDLRMQSSSRMLIWLMFAWIPHTLYAKVFTSVRMGAGPTLLKGPLADAQTSSQHATVRFGTWRPTSFLIGGIDLTSFRWNTPLALDLKHEVSGNDLRLFVGAQWNMFNLWLASGGGQLRVLDRPSPDEARPHRFISKSQELGISYDIYRAEYAKIEVCALYRETDPEKTWQQSYNLRKIETWQLDLGLKLLDF